ncbi:MAG: YjiH family protein [Firmicutes bacterium]|nr:YjiH family protein [Bacillota bacterium]
MNENNASTERRKYSTKEILRCLIPSLIGGGLFMIPIPQDDGSLIIPLTLIINKCNSFFGNGLIYLTLILVIVSAVMTFLGSVVKLKFIEDTPLLNKLFVVKPIWAIGRVVGGILIIMTFWQIGPEFLIGPDTGTFVLYDLLGTIALIGVIAGGILPLMTEFGLMEFVGTIVGPVWKKLFKIPGRSAVDCITSWLGDTSVAVILTNGQMEKGYYTQREAATIATTFSAVSITFALVVIDYVGFPGYFYQFYGIVALVGIVCAIICPRIPPLSRISNTYVVESRYEGEIAHPEGYNLISWAWHNALKKANDNGYTVKSYIADWIYNSSTLMFVLPPIIMAIGTIMLAVGYYTPILQWVGYPFIPLLNLLQIPEAQAASQTLLAGFADMFIPAILAAGSIENGYTRFLIAIISITQLIFISENGSMILSTKIPLNIIKLFLIFLERTIISLIVASLLLRLMLPELLTVTG